MKKPKRLLEWEDEKDSSGEYGMDLEVPDDDEIMDLDDIIDLDDEVLDDEQVEDSEVEVLDADGDLGLADFGPLDSKDDLDEGFLKDLSFAEKDDPIAEAKPTGGVLVKKVEKKAVDPLLDLDDDIFSTPAQESKPGFVEDAQAVSVGLAAGAVGESGATLDAFVDQIEARLLDAVREIVETRLPEIVRSILKEEIERLKEESR